MLLYETKFELPIKNTSMIARRDSDIDTDKRSSYVECNTVVIYE
jgi:hypothetical protein